MHEERRAEMGTWGMRAFDDDNAMDWLAELEGNVEDGADAVDIREWEANVADLQRRLGAA
jgi:hypothetical protein